MLKSITLENFKGISQKVEIPLRPITIMFGKNSAGKSTIIQALHYTREILERNNLDPDRTLYGGVLVDLGGFRNLVNNHDTNKAIVIKFDLDISDQGFPEPYTEWDSEFSSSVGLELSIEWSNRLETSIITNCKTWIGGSEAARFKRTKDNANLNIEFNSNHPILRLDEEMKETNWIEFEINNIFYGLPEKNTKFSLNYNRLEFDDDDFSDKITTFFLMAPIDTLRSFLEDFRYIGPLRKVPTRNFQASITKEESDWADGLAAWNELYQASGYVNEYLKNSADDTLVFETNKWLSSEKLNTGYQVKLKQFREISLDSTLMRALTNNTVFDDIADTNEEIKKFPIRKRLVLEEERSGLEVLPNDIGIGISHSADYRCKCCFKRPNNCC